jgi:predicted amino acid dehydrogenase
VNTFAFIGHPVSIAHIRKVWPLARILPEFLIASSLKSLPPFKVSHVTGIRSITGKEIDGYFIACPLLPKQMLDLDSALVLGKIIAGGKLAEKLGAKILGLGGYTSIVGDKGYSIAKGLLIPVTSGNSYTAWSVYEAVYKSAKARKVNLAGVTLAVVGATGSIGSLCTKKLSGQVKKIIITARHRDKLQRLKEAIRSLNSAEVIIESDAHAAVKDADIVVATTSAPEALLDISEFKSGAIVCDVSVPKNVADKAHSRADVTILEGGVIKLPFAARFGTDMGLAPNMVYACMAETMLLTLEERFTNYSLGDNINIDKLEEIADIAVRHGFEVYVP